MKYLVLGSEGQIGRSLVAYLKQQGEEVVGLDKEQCDLRHYSPLLDSEIAKADFVYFLAFDVGGSLYLKKYEKTKTFIDNNVQMMEEVFKQLELHNKKFIFASSQMSNMSYSTYGVLKRLGECYTETLGGLSVKFWNVYGEEYDEDKTHVITDFLKSAKENKFIKMRTDGTEVRQFLYADDCSKCLYELSKKYNEVDREKSLDITSFNWTTIEEVAKIVCSLYPGSRYEKSESKDTVQRDRRNVPTEYILKFWKPETKLKEGIKKVAKEMKLL